VSLRNSVVADAADGPRFLLTHVEDIEDRRLRELQLTHQATHDTLTGLPNSAELRARLAGRLCGDPAGRAGEHHVHTAAPDSARHGGATGLAVIFCDLDGMHRVNELFGSDTGDLVLVEVGRRLANGLRHGDTVARYGGDEFVVLADGLGTDECRELTKNLRTALDAPMRINGRLVRVRASFGTAWAACGTSVKDVLHTADQRMFDDKRSRRTVDHVKEQPAVVSELRLAGPLPERPVQPWVPQRPVAQRTTVRVWQNDRTAPATPAETVVVRSGEELDRLGDTARVHHVVCRGDIADLSALHRLPVLRSLVIADNGVLPYLDELEGCRRLRFLGVTRCPSLVDWAGAARTGVMFIEVGPGHAVPPLRGLTEAGRLRRLTLREALADGDPDLVELRRCLPDVRVRVEAGAREG
jgi:diguanylate cyclase (GGDEF)-like protein